MNRLIGQSLFAALVLVAGEAICAVQPPAGRSDTDTWIQRLWEVRYFLTVQPSYVWQGKMKRAKTNNAIPNTEYFYYAEFFHPASDIKLTAPNAPAWIDERLAVVAIEFDKQGLVTTPNSHSGQLQGRLHRLQYISSVVFAGEQLQLVSQGDSQLGARHTVSAVAGKTQSFFSHAGGLEAVAAHGALSLQAHTDQLEVLADQEVTVISVNDSIRINARTQIVLKAGQASITLDGADITFACPGTFSVKGSGHSLGGGGSATAELQKLPDSRVKLFDQAFVLKNKETGKPLANYPYKIKRADGSLEEGITDEAGNTHLVAAAEAENVTIEVMGS